jgi:hypothetical protein
MDDNLQPTTDNQSENTLIPEDNKDDSFNEETVTDGIGDSVEEESGTESSTGTDFDTFVGEIGDDEDYIESYMEDTDN